MDSSPRRTSPERQDATLQSSSKANTTASSTSPMTSSSYLSRKAHRYSSLKKKKPSTTSLLNKLFCSSPSLTSTDSQEENNSCVDSAMDDAAKTLRLDREASVRRTIQRSIGDAQASVLDGLCSSKPQASPPAQQITNDELFDDQGAAVMRFPTAMTSPSTPKASVPAKPTKTEAVESSDDDVVVHRSPGRIALFEDSSLKNDNKSEDSSSWDKTPSDDRDDKYATPGAGGDDDDAAFLPDDFGKPMATPTPYKPPTGSLDTGFTWQQVEAQIASAVAKANSVWIHQSQSYSPQRRSMTFTVEQVQARMQQVQIETQRDMERQLQAKIDAALTEAREQWLADSSGGGPTSVVQQKLDETESVGAAVEAAKAEWQAEHVPKKEMDERIQDALIKARIEWELLNETKLEQVVSECKSQAEMSLQEHGEQWKREHESEIEQLQNKYERKSHEQKDQAMMAKRLVQQHEAELAAVQARLTAEKAEQVAKLEVLVAESRQEREEHVARLQKELEESRAQAAALESQKNAELQEQVASLRAELQAAVASKDDLQTEKEQQLTTLRKLQDRMGSSPASSPIRQANFSPTRNARERQFAELEKQVNSLKEKLATKEAQPTSDATGSAADEIVALKQEVAALKAEKERQVSLVEKQVVSLREELATKTSEEEDASTLKSRLEEAERQRTEAVAKLQELQVETEAKGSHAAKKLAEEIASLKSLIEQLKNDKEREVGIVKKQLEALEAKSRSASRSPPRNASNGESLVKAKQELASLRREIDQIKKDKENEVSEIQKELKSVQEQLVQKEKELMAAARSTPSRRVEASPARSRQGTPRHGTPLRSPSPSSSRTPTRSSVELQEHEKETLRLQIGVLEEQVNKLKSEHGKALKELRAQGERDLAAIKKEMEIRVERHMQTERELKDSLATVDSADKEELLERIEQLEAERKAERSGGLREVQKKEDLLNRIAALERKEKELCREHEIMLQDVRTQSDTEIRRLQREIEKEKNDRVDKERQLQQALSETESFEKEDLLQRIDSLEAQLENEHNGAVLLKLKLTNVEKEAKAAEKEHNETLARVRQTLGDEIKKLRADLDELSAIEEAMQIATNERDSVIDELKHVREELDQERKKHHDQQDELRKLHVEAVAKLEHEANTRVELTEQESKASLVALEEKLEKLRAERDEIENRTGLSAEEEQKLRSELADTKAQAEKDKLSFEERLKKVQDEQEKDSEEMLSQLDLVEKEHKEKLAQLEKMANEKDAIITALGAQLAEAQTRAKATEESHKSLSSELDQARANADKYTKELRTVKSDFVALRAKHENFSKDAESAKEAACEKAREEMIERAEVQFKQANDLYVKLKKQYDLCKKKVETIDADLKKTKDKLSKSEAAEVDLTSKIADLRAAQAKVEAEAARKSKEYRREMERLLKAAENFENKAREAESSSRQAHKRLASVLAEKEQIQKDHDEMKSVCEELMAMVEGQHHEC